MLRVRAAAGAVSAAVLGLALVGCGAEQQPEGPPESPPGQSDGEPPGEPTDEPTVESTEPTDPAALAGMVSLNISGGIAGVNEGIEVDPDGDVRVHEGDDPRAAPALTEAELTELERTLARVDFSELPGASLDDQAADMFQYLLYYDGRSLLTDGTEPLGPVDDVIAQLSGHLNDRQEN